MNGVVTVTLTVVLSNPFFFNKTGNTDAIKKKINRSDCIEEKILWSLEDTARKSNEK